MHTHNARRYDYRLCYRQSATERLRSLQAISWSWRPYSCALAPVRGEAFDRCGCPPAATPGSPTCPARNPAHTRAPRWLGPRHLLLLGDSLMAQLYYSLVWLLGDSLLEQHDLFGYATGESTVGSTRLGACASRVHSAPPPPARASRHRPVAAQGCLPGLGGGCEHAALLRKPARA